MWTYQATDAAPVPTFTTGLVLAAGALGTAMGTQTASSLGFAVGTVDGKNQTPITTAAVTAELPGRTYVAVALYVLVGLAVFGTWLLREAESPELVSAFALSLLGWIIGAAATIFKAVGAPSAETATPDPAATPARASRRIRRTSKP